MARNYLAIQGTSVPCERAFSSSKMTDDDRRTSLSADHFGKLQVAKRGMMAARTEGVRVMEERVMEQLKKFAEAEVVEDSE